MLLSISVSTITAAPEARWWTNQKQGQDDLARRAEQAQHKGDYRAAAQMYQEMLRADPDSAEIRANLGLMDHLLGDHAAAIHEFRTALQEDPRLFVPNLFLGLDLLDVEKPREAVAYLKRAYEINPHDANAILGLGRAYTKMGDLLKAQRSYNEAVRLNPQNSRAWSGLGSTYWSLEDEGVEHLAKAASTSAYFQALGAESFLEQGRLNDAIAKYRRLLDAPSAPACIRSNFGLALIQSGRFADAEQEFQRDLTDCPRCLMARLGLARIALGRGDTTKAIDELSKVWQVDPDFLSANAPNLWQGLTADEIGVLERQLKNASAPEVPAGLMGVSLAVLARWREDPVETFADVSTNYLAGSAWPVSHETAQKISQARLAQFYSEGKYAACRESLKSGLPRLVLKDALFLAECAYDSGDFRTSFLASQQAIEASAESPAAWYWRIKASEVLAVNALVQADLSEPNSPAVHVLLGDIYRDRRDFKQAEAEYRKAIELKPRDAAAHLGLAATFHRAFRLDEALPEVRTTLELIPQSPEANYLMADILVYRHEFDQAEPYAKLALRGPQSNLPPVHALLGKIYASQGHASEAIKEFEQALPDDRDGSWYYQIYTLYKQVGDASAAREALKQSQALRKQQEQRAQETIRAVE